MSRFFHTLKHWANQTSFMIVMLAVSVALLIIFGQAAIRFRPLFGRPILLSNQSPTVDYIQPWMTFSYLEKVFKLPDQYLKNNLNITDSHYPNITIRRAANEQNVPLNTFLDSVKNSIWQYTRPSSAIP